MGLKSPEGSGIKGGKVSYHVRRMLVGFEMLEAFPTDHEFVVTIIVYHARLAAGAALRGMYHGKRPDGK